MRAPLKQPRDITVPCILLHSTLQQWLQRSEPSAGAQLATVSWVQCCASAVAATSPGSAGSATSRAWQTRWQKQVLLQPISRWFSTPSCTAVRGLEPKQLTSCLTTAKTPVELLQVVNDHCKAMNSIHIATAYSCLGRMCKHTEALAQQAVVQQLLQLLEPLVTHQQQQLGTWCLANIIHACYYLGCKQTMQQLLAVFLQPQVLSTASPQGIANVLWAASKAGMVLQAAELQQLLAAFDWRVQQAKPQEIANVLLGVVKLGEQISARKLSRMQAAFVQQLDATVPLDISSMLWACARLRLYPYKLFAALEQQQQQLCQVLVAAASPQELANMAWACGTLGHQGELLPGVLLQQAALLLTQHTTSGSGSGSGSGSDSDSDSGKSSSFKAQEACNLCWAAAVLDMRQHYQQVLQLAAACSLTWPGLVASELQQLYQAHLWLLDCQLPAGTSIGGRGLLAVLTHQQVERCRHVWQQQLAENASASKVSGLHQAVFAALQRLPPHLWQQQPVIEQRTADGAFGIDIAVVTADGLRLAVEVDGPVHFIRPGHKTDGPTQYRHRALVARGYTVISIPHWEWDPLVLSQQQERYLLRKLPV